VLGFWRAPLTKGIPFPLSKIVGLTGEIKFFEDNNNDEENGDVARVCAVAQHVVLW